MSANPRCHALCPLLLMIATLTLAGEQQTTQDASARWATPQKAEGLDNFYRVSDTLYRSAQPTAEGFKSAEKLGIRTVVNLRSHHGDEGLAKGTSLKLVSIRTDAWVTGIGLADLAAFLKVVANPENQPVLVHCQHGSDRTGTMCAIYRIAVQGWSRGDAITEMTTGPFGFHTVWKWLPKFIRELDLVSLREMSGLEAPQNQQSAKETNR